MYGYMGKMLFVDLSTGEFEDKVIPEEWYRDFLGGPALGARILYEYMPAHADVFGEDSMVGFVATPFDGSNFFCGGRYTVVSKSPVYNGWNDANSGGFFGPAIKKSGYDGIFVRGISPKPVYLFVDDGKAELRDATKYWGMQATELENALFTDLEDNKISYAFIGPAGENLSNMAAVMNDGHRAAGRGGTGAVMGSKKLKAVVCRGNQTFEIADKAGMAKLSKAISESLKQAPMLQGMRTFGTTGGFMPSLLSGDAAVKNFSVALCETDKTPEDFEPLAAPMLNEKYKVKSYRCSSCPIGCGAFMDTTEDERFPVKNAARPEYESVGWFGSAIMNTDPVVLIKCNHLCNEYGADTISPGGTLGWAFEAFNEGAITKEQLDGIEPFWGDGNAAVALTEKIVSGEGCGKILTMGSRYAAEYWNAGKEFLFVASGIEIAQHDPRRAPGYIRTYQVDPTPGRHVKGGLAKANDRMTWEQKYDYRVTGYADLVEICTCEYINASGLCIFSPRLFPPGAIFEGMQYVTGYKFDKYTLRLFGMRAFMMRWAFNLREGLRRKDFTVTDRMIGNPPMRAGQLAGISLDNERLVENLYNAIGFNPEGVPCQDVLEFVGGLEPVIADLYPPKE